MIILAWIITMQNWVVGLSCVRLSTEWCDVIFRFSKVNSALAAVQEINVSDCQQPRTADTALARLVLHEQLVTHHMNQLMNIHEHSESWDLWQGHWFRILKIDAITEWQKYVKNLCIRIVIQISSKIKCFLLYATSHRQKFHKNSPPTARQVKREIHWVVYIPRW